MFAFDDLKMSRNDKEFLRKIKQFDQKNGDIQVKLQYLEKRIKDGPLVANLKSERSKGS